MLAADVGHFHTSVGLLQDRHDLALRKSTLSHCSVSGFPTRILSFQPVPREGKLTLSLTPFTGPFQTPFRPLSDPFQTPFTHISSPLRFLNAETKESTSTEAVTSPVSMTAIPSITDNT